MSVTAGPDIVENGLIFSLDAANTKSYSGSGAIFTDLITRQNSTNVGTYAYNTALYGVPVFELNNNGTTSDGQIQVVTQNLNSLALTQNFSVMFAAKKNYYGIAGNNIGNSQLFQGVSEGYTTGWRITETRQGTPGSAYTSNQIFSFGYNDINTALTVTDTGSTNRMSIGAFTVSSSTIFGFLNGVTNSRANPLTYASGTSTPRISFTGAGVGSWNGLFGFFMIYNRALSSDEINQNYNALRSRYGL